MTNMIKVIVYAIDTKDVFKKVEDLKTHVKESILNGNNFGITQQLIEFGEVQNIDIGKWSDDHELNKNSTPISTFENYFEDNEVEEV